MKITKEQLKQIIKEELDLALSPVERASFERAKEEWDPVWKELLDKLNAAKTLEDHLAATEALKAHLSKAPTLKTLEEQEGQEEQHFEIMMREDNYGDAELLSREQADELLKSEDFTYEGPWTKGRYIAKVVKVAKKTGDY